MVLMRKVSASILALALPTTGCSTLTQSGMAKRQDYLEAMTLQGGGESAKARANLPAKESGGFITTLEKGWLDILNGKGDPTPLIVVGNDLESRKTLSLSREATAYFYKETEDGYFPAEHEAIALHIVTGFAALQRGDKDSALIEARKAAFYLQSDFGAQRDFDDPALRMWLATLWTGAGNWEGARVDLRALAAMGADYAWAVPLAERASAPKQLILVVAGAGPDLEWTPGIAHGTAAFAFVPSAGPATFRLGDIDIKHRAPTLPWYARHVERDHVIRDVLSGSRYMVESVVPVAASGAVLATGVALGTTIIVASIAAGGAIAYYGFMALASSGVTGEAVGYSFGAVAVAAGSVAYFGSRLGLSVMKRMSTTSGELADAGLNPINGYRYVRFLPDQIYLAASDEAMSSDQLMQGTEVVATPFLRVQNADAQVLAFYSPGTNAERAMAAQRNQWSDPTFHRDWVMLAGKGTAKAAWDGCSSLQRDGFGFFQIATWTEFLNARSAGLLDPKRNKAFGKRLSEESEIWSREDEQTVPTKRCRTIDTKTGSEGVVQDCSLPRVQLCYAAHSKKSE